MATMPKEKSKVARLIDKHFKDLCLSEKQLLLYSDPRDSEKIAILSKYSPLPLQVR